MRQAQDRGGGALEENHWAADVLIVEVVEKYGAFWAGVNGHVFDDASDWARNRTNLHHGCPSICLSIGVRRSQTFGRCCMHPGAEGCGEVIADAAAKFVETTRPTAQGSHVRRATVFVTNCQKLERELTRVNMRSRDCVAFLVRMRREGLPAPLAEAVRKHLE